MDHGPHFAFIVSRFPKLTETFILRELTGLEARGLRFDLYALIHEEADQLQHDAAELDRRAHYYDWLSRETLAAQWHWLRTTPSGWCRALASAVRSSWRSRDTMLRLPVIWLVAGAMARQMESDGVERVHAHWLTYPTLAAMIIKDLAGIPFSATGHAEDIYKEPHVLGDRIAAADLVLTCTEDGRKVLIEQAGAGAADKVRVIYHGSDLSRFETSPPAVHPDALRLVCVGVLHEMKGHRFLLDAVRLLVDRGVDVHLDLVGEGDRLDELVAQAKRIGVAERVDFLGRRQNAEVRAILDASDIFVLAAISAPKGMQDGIPNVLVEALAVGRPVVASALPGIRELITDRETGMLSVPGDPVSIADAIAALAADPTLRATVISGGRARVEAEHDSVHNIDLVFQALQELDVRPSS